MTTPQSAPKSPAPNLRREAGILARFGLAGLANTGFGLAVILGLELGLGVERHLANAGGYAAGAVLGFLLNRGFVFKGVTPGRGMMVRYVAAMVIAFAVNQGMLTLAGATLPSTDLWRTVAQVLSLGTYTVTQFALMRLWVFRHRS